MNESTLGFYSLRGVLKLGSCYFGRGLREKFLSGEFFGLIKATQGNGVS